MAAFYALSPLLARVVPLVSYLASAFIAGAIAVDFHRRTASPTQKNDAKNIILLSAAAWIIGFRPLAIQSNLLMVDNLAAAFALGSLWLLIRSQWKLSAFVLAMALATRYSVWNAAIAMFFALLWLEWRRKSLSWKKPVLFTLIASLGAAPILLRNYVFNGGFAVFPMGSDLVNPNLFFHYGRGYDWQSLLLFPFDLLYTNSFGKNLYDYTLGKLFYAQLAAIVFLAVHRRKDFLAEIRGVFVNAEGQAIAIFSLIYFLIWFYGSQQLRFLLPSILLLNLMMFWIVYRLSPKWLISLVVALSLFSILSIQKDSWLMALGKKESIFAAPAAKAKKCLEEIPHNALVGWRTNDVAGFFDRDFVFLTDFGFSPPWGIRPKPDFIYSSSSVAPEEGYEPWPAENPCALRRLPEGQGS